MKNSLKFITVIQLCGHINACRQLQQQQAKAVINTNNLALTLTLNAGPERASVGQAHGQKYLCAFLLNAHWFSPTFPCSC